MTPPAGSPERKLGSLDVDAYLADPSRKQAFVTPMFDIIAPRYDAFTKLFSLGMDAGWKRRAIAAAIAVAPGARRVLDLASGTGDVAAQLARALPQATVEALDASPRMIDAARARLDSVDADVAGRVTPMVGDMMALPQERASIDVVSASYGVRNVPDPAQCVREMARVLRPGGALVTLDFYRPGFAPWRALFLWYLGVAGNVVGWLWHRDPIVYGYIARSIRDFMTADEFSALLRREGFEVVSVRWYLFGGIAQHVARRVG
ncbi:ubiquinone/menaquinone biosynthesis methyltransferase [Gemmatimonas sp.]|uniref:ubiquinone/menaquinone biosynthesis methyltransferase n=1 Tax=Gemmatimonas sp. TaxID=1962908 RepID=UPI00286D077B|nr:ubiquinone/menaquinone biosynthesis methyltransferase [Gemmatimonas sp.]